MSTITASDILVGSDEDFVNNLYMAVLGRWPDAGGFAHLMAKIAGSQKARVQAIVEVSTSAEAALRGRPILVPDPLRPSEPLQALRQQLALRTDFLRELMALRPPLTLDELKSDNATVSELHADIASLRQDVRDSFARTADQQAQFAELRSQLAALRREIRERFAAIQSSAPTQATGSDVADYVNDLLAVAEARMEIRVRALEKRIH